MAIASAAAPGISGAAGDLPRLDQLDPHIVGRLHERDARAARILDRSLEQAGAEPLEPLDIGFEMRRVEAEVLEAVVRARVARPRRSLVRAPEMLTFMPPSSLWQRTKRSPNTRVSSLVI